jgi:hypothetical protein
MQFFSHTRADGRNGVLDHIWLLSLRSTARQLGFSLLPFFRRIGDEDGWVGTRCSSSDMAAFAWTATATDGTEIEFSDDDVA